MKDIKNILKKDFQGNKNKVKSFEEQKTEILKKIQRLDKIKLKKQEEKEFSKKEIQEIGEKIQEEINNKEEANTEDELEQLVSRVPSLRVQQSRNINPFLEASNELSQETRLEEQIRDTPTAATAPTRTETDNSQRYIANAPSYTSSSGYNSSRGNYEGTGYPEEIRIRDARFESPAPFIESMSSSISSNQRVVRPWMDTMQSPGPQTMENPEQKKYESMDERKRKKIW
ncbi:MAG: hypothetical protein AABX54_01410 [Nanoarchaeota archaeon]